MPDRTKEEIVAALLAQLEADKEAERLANEKEPETKAEKLAKIDAEIDDMVNPLKKEATILAWTQDTETHLSVLSEGDAYFKYYTELDFLLEFNPERVITERLGSAYKRRKAVMNSLPDVE